MRKQGLKSVRNAVISIFLLLFLFGAAGVGYVWYVGRNGDVRQSEVAGEVIDTTKPLIAPQKPSPDARESAAVQALTSPITPGSNATITVKTNAGSSCVISVEYNKIPSKDSGLTPKVANDYGIVTWTWTVDQNAPLGKWPVKVTCVFYEKSAVVIGDLNIVNKIEE